MKRIAKVVVGAAFGVIAGFAQDDSVIRVTTNLVQVDAVITDRRGQPVTNLTKDDFEILQDGKPRPISNFSFVELGPPGVQADRSTPSTSPGSVRRGDVRRTIAIVVDDLRIQWLDLVEVRDTLRKFVDTQVREGDLVSTSLTGTDSGALAQFTTKRDAMKAAVNRIRWSGMGFPGMAAGETAGNDSVSFQQLSLISLRSVVEAMAEMPGRKSIIFFSTGGNPDDMQVLLQEVTSRANAAGVTIYTIDPRGMKGYFPTPAAGGPEPALAPPGQSDDSADEPLAGLRGYSASQQLLATLARDTGGLAFRERRIGYLLQQAMNDQGSYYLLGYNPGGGSFDRKFHKIQVRVRRADLNVRSRNGYIGQPPATRESLSKDAGNVLARALMSPFEASDIRTRLSAVFSTGGTTDGKGSALSSVVFVDGRDLQFERLPDGGYRGSLEFLLTTFDVNGMASQQTAKGFRITLNQEDWKKVSETGVSYVIPHPIQKPGAYQVRLAVRDVLSGELGSASQSVEVPDLKKKRVALSGIVLRAPDAEPNPYPLSIPAVRAFRRGREIAWLAEVYHPSAKLQWGVGLYHGGSLVFQASVDAITTQPLTGGRDVLARGTVKLPDTLEAGEYYLKLTVKDENASAKDTPAAQWIDLEVVP